MVKTLVQYVRDSGRISYRNMGYILEPEIGSFTVQLEQFSDGSELCTFAQTTDTKDIFRGAYRLFSVIMSH